MIETIFLFFAGLGGFEILLVILLPFLLMIWAIVDLIKSDFKDQSTKIVWALVILFFPFLGSIIYLIFGRSQKVTA